MKASNLIKFPAVIVISTVFFFVSCNKEARIQEDISGNWEIYQCKLIDSEGFDSYYSSEGALVIEDFVNDQSSFSLQCTYTNDSGSLQTKSFNGTLKTSGKNTELETVFESGNQPETGLSVILYHGKDDLKIEFRRPSQRIEVLGRIKK